MAVGCTKPFCRTFIGVDRVGHSPTHSPTHPLVWWGGSSESESFGGGHGLLCKCSRSVRVELTSRCLSSLLPCLEAPRLTSWSGWTFSKLPDSGQFSLARNALGSGGPGLLAIVRGHEAVPSGFGRLGTTAQAAFVSTLWAAPPFGL